MNESAGKKVTFMKKNVLKIPDLALFSVCVKLWDIRTYFCVIYGVAFFSRIFSDFEPKSHTFSIYQSHSGGRVLFTVFLKFFELIQNHRSQIGRVLFD